MGSVKQANGNLLHLYSNQDVDRPPPLPARKMSRPLPLDPLKLEDIQKQLSKASSEASSFKKYSSYPEGKNCNRQKLNNIQNNLKPEPCYPLDAESAVSSDMTSFRWPSRKLKKPLVIAALAGACFLLGLAVPFLIKSLQGGGGSGRARTVYDLHLPRSPSFVGRGIGRDFDSVLKDLFISVKTTKKYHHPRLVILLETWVSLVKGQTWFFTDSSDEDMSLRADGHLVVTNCSESHARTALACKMAAEFDHFLKSHKRWWCHFDDDNYVHVIQLAKLLQSYNPDHPLYLGKPSTAKPLEIFDLRAPQNTSHFWFATGGAGFCVSRAMALKMAPFAANGKFVETGDQFWFPDDVTLGYIIEHLLGESLTVVPEFHSHLEPMRRIRSEDLPDQISFSYITYNGVSNAISLPGPFPVEADPTR